HRRFQPRLQDDRRRPVGCRRHRRRRRRAAAAVPLLALRRRQAPPDLQQPVSLELSTEAARTDTIGARNNWSKIGLRISSWGDGDTKRRNRFRIRSWTKGRREVSPKQSSSRLSQGEENR